VQSQLRQGPGEEARRALAATADGPPPSRWTLKGIQATFSQVQGFTLSGVWRWLRERVGVKLRSAKVQQFSPDPDYQKKLAAVKRCLRKAAETANRTTVIFLDEAGYSRWPEPAGAWAPDTAEACPLADRRGAGNGMWRIIGGLNAQTGRVTYLDNYIVGREKLIQMYGLLAKSYPRSERIYVVQDNWSIHTHADVLTALERHPRITPIWLPTYAPWLNPIEKLWRWLKEHTLKMHRLADDWPKLQDQVHQFMDQFATQSKKLLRYVGLAGDGELAQCCR
jgi:hypothetical protein